MQNLDTRIAQLEAQAGIGLETPTVIIVGFGTDDNEVHRAGCGGVEIHREPDESVEAFRLRAEQLGRANRQGNNGCVVWMRP